MLISSCNFEKMFIAYSNCETGLDLIKEDPGTNVFLLNNYICTDKRYDCCCFGGCFFVCFCSFFRGGG